MTIYLIASPPFGEYFWNGVKNRLLFHGYNVQIVSLWETNSPLTQVKQTLCSMLTKDDCVATHGLLLPFLLWAIGDQPVHRIIVSNGPFDQLDPFSSLAQKVPSKMLSWYLHPLISLPFFRSSFGMRRLVINPYVMDAEMVKQSCAPLKKHTARKSLSTYIQKIPTLPLPKNIQSPGLVLWGDQDILYPITIATKICSRYPSFTRKDIRGGAFLHPLERPWAMADLIHENL